LAGGDADRSSWRSQINEAIESLMNQIQRTHGLSFELAPVRLVPSTLSATTLVPDDRHEEEIYKRDFLPQWRVLNARTGARVRKVLRSNSGRFCIAGTLAVVSDRGVEWYSVFGDRFSGHDQDYRIGFLKAVLVEGPGLLEDLCRPGRAAA
jgi:hypothetical protein